MASFGTESMAAEVAASEQASRRPAQNLPRARGAGEWRIDFGEANPHPGPSRGERGGHFATPTRVSAVEAQRPGSYMFCARAGRAVARPACSARMW